MKSKLRQKPQLTFSLKECRIIRRIRVDAMIKKVILWFLVIGCMATIFNFSSQVAEESKKTSSKVITKIVETVDIRKELTEIQKKKIAEDLTFVVRKGAHFSIYALLGILIFLLVKEYNFSTKRSFITSITASFIYACSDEFHQTFVSGRSGEVRDVLIDTVGAIVGCLLIIFIEYIIKNIKNRRNN